MKSAIYDGKSKIKTLKIIAIISGTPKPNAKKNANPSINSIGLGKKLLSEICSTFPKKNMFNMKGIIINEILFIKLKPPVFISLF